MTQLVHATKVVKFIFISRHTVVHLTRTICKL